MFSGLVEEYDMGYKKIRSEPVYESVSTTVPEFIEQFTPAPFWIPQKNSIVLPLFKLPPLLLEFGQLRRRIELGLAVTKPKYAMSPLVAYMESWTVTIIILGIFLHYCRDLFLQVLARIFEGTQFSLCESSLQTCRTSVLGLGSVPQLPSHSFSSVLDIRFWAVDMHMRIPFSLRTSDSSPMDWEHAKSTGVVGAFCSLRHCTKVKIHVTGYHASPNIAKQFANLKVYGEDKNITDAIFVCCGF